MSEVLERIALLSKERRALFQALLSTSGIDSPVIERRDRTGPVPMSYAQQRLWFIEQLDPGNPAYNCPVPLRLKGPLGLEALKQSLQTIIQRHEILRTTYSLLDGLPVQTVHPYQHAPLVITDLTSMDEADKQEALQRLILEDGNRAFDFAAGPVIRTELIRLDPEDHVLLVDVHHIANDHWSVKIFFQELADDYNARVTGQQPNRPELPIQYADYALWQLERMNGPFGKEQLSFWRENLAGLTQADLATDHRRPSVLSHRGGLTRMKLHSSLVQKLQAIGKAEGATLFMTLLAGFNILLARYTGQADLAVGCSATGRDRPELEGLIGFFVNTIVLRMDMSDNPSFRELVRKTRAVVLNAYAHSEFPFDLLVRELNPQREAGRTPLVPVMFILDDTPDEVARFERLEARWIEPTFTTTKFDLLINARPAPDGIYSHVQYSSDLFRPDTIERLVGHYRTLLEAAASSPDLRVSDLPLLTQQEYHLMLKEWNNTAAPFPAQSCLHDLYEARCEQHGEMPAIIFENCTVSYDQLDFASNRLANRLRGLGVGPEVLVAILVERSPEFVVALLAVLKAGGAYISLDPVYVEGRLAFITREMGISILLTQRSLQHPFEQTMQVVYVDAMAELLTDDAPEYYATAPTPENLAYVICTSGSTGTPKAIALQHRGVVNNLEDLNNRFDVGPGDRVLLLSSLGFDMSVYETLGMLVAGGTVIIPDLKEARDPARWVDLMVKHSVTLWNSAPALLELLVEELEMNRGPMLPDLRLALLGGDWIPVTLPDRLRAFAPRVRVISLGGATEASIHSTIYPVEVTDPDWVSIPYGRPMANQRAYILDKWLQPVPIGVPGELYLGGEGLARGYLHRPDLTAERFIDWRFNEGRVERLFKTGDLARWRRDGVIELLGRLDFQVKINGLRVELGEIESVLRRHAAVQEAAVLAQEGKKSKLLIAYFVTRRGLAVSENELRKHLAQELPLYMIPALLVPLDRLPTSNNGKVDRLALSMPDPDRRGNALAPRNEVEDRIMTVWRTVLGINQCGINDNFFELGGDSFKAIRVARRIDVPVVELFKNPTIRSLAAYLREGGRPSEDMLCLLTPRSRKASVSLVCIPYGGGNAASYHALANTVPTHFALWSLALPGHDHSETGKNLQTVEETARRCCDEIINRVTGPIVVYGQCAGASLAVELTRLLLQRGADVRAVYVGAALPDANPKASLQLERSSSDLQLQEYLKSLGGFDGALDWTEVTDILRLVRHDLIQSSKFFETCYSAPPNLTVPLRCVIGDQDIATKGFESRFREWELFAADVELIVIPGAGHYFIKSNANELAALLARYHSNDPGYDKQTSLLARP